MDIIGLVVIICYYQILAFKCPEEDLQVNNCFNNKSKDCKNKEHNCFDKGTSHNLPKGSVDKWLQVIVKVKRQTKQQERTISIIDHQSKYLLRQQTAQE